MTALRPPNRPDHHFDYTPVDLLAKYDPPELAEGLTPTTYDYDADRNLRQIVRPDGLTITHEFDAAGRLQRVISPEDIRTYTYDQITGHLTNVSSSDGTALAYTYDGPLQISEQWLGPVSGTLHRTYDNDFLVASTRVNQGPATHLARDADSLLTGLGPMSIIRDEATGFVTSTSVGVVQTHTTYDDYGALATSTATINGTPVLHTAYLRDLTGRINGKVETIEGVTTTFDYNFDMRARLTAVMVDGQVTQLYDYDQNGNRTRFEDLAGNHIATVGRHALPAAGETQRGLRRGGEWSWKTWMGRQRW